MAHLNEVFGRINEQGNVEILYSDDGCQVNQLDANVYPVGSKLSARHEHAEGIVLTVEDSRKLGINIE